MTSTASSPPALLLLAFRLPPARVSDYSDLERGNRIVLPPSWLHRCREVAVLICRLREPTMGRSLHVGVAGFDAPEDVVWIPAWLAGELNIFTDGVPLQVDPLPQPPDPCRFLRIRPRDAEFYDLRDPRAAIEEALRHVPVITVGTQLQLVLQERRMYFDVRHLVPAPVALLTDTTCDLDLERGPAAERWEQRRRDVVDASARRMRERRASAIRTRFRRNRQLRPE